MTQKLKIGLFAATITLCFIMIFAPAMAQAQSVIREVRVDGNERIDTATVLSYLNLKVGDQATPDALDQSLKTLFSTGLFADVSLQQQGDALIVSVLENPIINEIAFEGNEDIEDSELLQEIQFRPRQVFTRTKVQADVSRLYQVYRRNGLFSVVIEPKLIKLDQNRVNLVFEIDEGDVTSVQSIRFVGNKKFDDNRLRSEIATKEEVWYRFYASDDRYDPDRLAFDQEQLRRFYLKQGYADFNLLSAVAELSKDRKHFFITFTLEEGERYKVSDVKISSQLRNFDSSVLNQHIVVKKDDWYNSEYVQESVDAITDALGDLQYAFVSVRPQIDRNRENQTLSVTFEINETPRIFVERINVNGNVRTLDKVVRREFLLSEGDPFNRSKLARSEQNIKDLNFFETAEVEVKPGSAPDKTIIDVDVAEKSTGELSLGAGFSTSDGPLADFRLSERNFLGKGQQALIGATIAGERTEFDLGFTEPHFMERDLAAGIDAFHITRDLQDESSFDQRRTGAALRLGYPLSERWRQTLKYRIERNDITDVQADASLFIQEQEGQRDTSAVSQRLTYDDRDSQIFPTEGLFYWLDTEVAGLGGDARYVSARTGASYFYPIADQWVFNLLGETGAIEGYGDEDVNINERFFIGGNTLRGFETAGLGPRDASTGDALGGNYFYRGTAELSFPVGLPEELGVQGHAFSDFGSIWNIDNEDSIVGSTVLDESSIRVSAGLGVSWRSPFGPIRADFAFPVESEDFDEEENFRFNFGTRF